MGTSSNRSAGTQITKNGVTQGNVLVDPVTGFPVGVIQDNSGVRRLAVDASLSVGSITVDTRDLDASTDNVALKDTNTGAKLKINNDGSIDTNVNIQASSDNIAIADPVSGNVLKPNADGSINVVVESGTGVVQNVKSFFSSVTSVASGVTTTVLTYTVPVSKTSILQRSEVSGTNIATYDLFINGIQQARTRTYFGASLNSTIDFSSNIPTGITLNAGDTVVVKVTHQRPDLGDFDARLQLIENG